MSDQPLLALWDAAANSPFIPNVGKDAQFLVGFVLLSIGFVLTALFGLNLSVKNLPVLAVPASFAFAFGAVYMICAVGVYV
ncbi:Putative oligosaccharyltransferase complex subunit [Septoria linicola]|uniref:Dolichyl-diphosphooligosaccharide-protein glycosyltransferase subunit OST5 n=1 Tax=Septoria linicola TaxID=215465 RepID=A0A9Q9EL12_9PEZI|nr:putative oligosaccharyltransferase complex subunit [Septoria linicola]USW53882.1 Putative oligosaccharyltransferase complex subunit [Septoria linicola]